MIKTTGLDVRALEQRITRWLRVPPGPFTNNRTIPQPYRTHVRLSRGFFATQAADRKETNGDGSHRAGDPDGVAGCAALARLRIIEPKTMLWSGLIAHQYPWPANPRGTKTARW
jgi:hypothetical protein